MVNNKSENPLKKMEEQMERILFINNKIDLKNDKANHKIKLNNSNKSNIREMKKQLLNLIKELRAKSSFMIA